MWLHRLADADASCGGKAVGLARLIAAGLPVPEGFVVDDRAFRALLGEIEPPSDQIGHAFVEAHKRLTFGDLPAELVDEVDERAAHLGMLAVRSSATIEDGDAGAAAGVFSSRTKLEPRDVWEVIRIVWMSALTPLAATYAQRRGGRISIGVIVQRFIEGEVSTIYTRMINDPASQQTMVQTGGKLQLVARDSVDPRVQLALRAEAAIGTPTGADVEIVEEASGQLWIVQARPMVHRTPTPQRRPPPMVTALLVSDGRTWTWDVAHNPDPLSPAQAGLVERVDRAAIAPWSLRVCAGFLYTAPSTDVRARAVVAPTTIAALDVRVRELEAAMASALSGPRTPSAVDSQRATTGGSIALAEAIERYLAFYAIWATELAPLIATARANLSPAQLAGARPSSVESTLLAAARGELDESAVLDRIGVMSPAWDIAVPTFAERPTLVREAIARAKTIVALGSTVIGSTGPTPVASDDHDLARAAADLAERDDVWFARAQWIVRSAILERARELGIDPDDAFWIPLDDLVYATTFDPDDARRLAAGTRGAATRAAQWAMPIVVGGTPSDGAEPRRAFTGVGTGPRVTGRVVRLESLAATIAVSPTDVVVTRAVTPALAVLVIGCAALVSETGGLLDHGAALARELGIPCVVGCEGAWALTDGMVVTVDGDAGTVDLRV